MGTGTFVVIRIAFWIYVLIAVDILIARAFGLVTVSWWIVAAPEIVAATVIAAGLALMIWTLWIPDDEEELP
jgi:hypothetical protein